MAHKHPDDREPVLELLNEIRSSGGQGALFHRIIDCQGREHRVLTLARAAEGQGPVTAIQGVVMDLTRTVAAEAAREAAAAVAGAYANKATIEQAKGIIMGRLDVQACDAFNVLAARSQHTNTKLAAVAAGACRCRGSGHAPDDAAMLGDFLARRNIPMASCRPHSTSVSWPAS